MKSMTAFAKYSKQDNFGNVTWEIKAVNSRFLDLIIKLPNELRELEPEIRGVISNFVSRGKIECSLRFIPSAVFISSVAPKLMVDEALVVGLLEANNEIGKIAFKHNLSLQHELPSKTLLKWPNVVTFVDYNLENFKIPLLESLTEACENLVAARMREGEKLKILLAQRIMQLRQQIAPLADLIPEIKLANRERILQQFTAAKLECNNERLEQELVLFAHKIDVSEELDRLTLHLTEVERILAFDDGAGRRLDFLMQELNREANTLGSKSQDIRVTRAAVECKVLIEQMREQVQNVE